MAAVLSGYQKMTLNFCAAVQESKVASTLTDIVGRLCPVILDLDLAPFCWATAIF